MPEFGIGGFDPRFYLDRVGAARPKTGSETAEGAEKGEFSQFLESAINQVNEIQRNADDQITKVIRGEVEDIHTAMIELQKADLSFQSMMEIRTKIMDAYQELMRIQV